MLQCPLLLCAVAALRGRTRLVLYLHARADVHIQLAHNNLHFGYTIIQ